MRVRHQITINTSIRTKPPATLGTTSITMLAVGSPAAHTVQRKKVTYFRVKMFVFPRNHHRWVSF